MALFPFPALETWRPPCDDKCGEVPSAVPCSKMQARHCLRSVKEILAKLPVNTRVVVHGWIKSIRKQKELTFIQVNDGSGPGKLQAVIPTTQVPPDMTHQSAVKLEGTLVPTPERPQPSELHVEDAAVIGRCPADFPFAPRKTYPADYIRNYLHLRPKTEQFASLLRVRDSVHSGLNDFFHKNRFVKIDVPVITSNDCEGAGEVFAILPANKGLINEMRGDQQMEDDAAFFDKRVFLTVSGQLHLEAAANALSKVYSIGPTFRAENQQSKRHLSEFYMVEAELAFQNAIDGILQTMESMIKHVLKHVLNSCERDIKLFVTNGFAHILDSQFATITFKEASDILEQHSSQLQNPFKRNGLNREQELFLVKHLERPVFVVDWPSQLKPFYVRQKEDRISESVDLLFPEVGELCGGSLREQSYEALKDRLKSEGQLDDLGWYLELRKFGGVPTGGFGMGLERLLQFMLHIPNIREAIPFPRWPHNCTL